MIERLGAMDIRRRRLALMALPLALAVACRTEPGAAIIVEADTTAVAGAAARPVVVPAPAPAAPEVVIIEERAADPPPGQLPIARDLAAESAPAPAASAPAAPERIVLPAGTRIALELRTPLHSGTTRVGDRFAARTVVPLPQGGRVVLEPGALVEGRIAAVVRAEADEPGRIELDFRSLVLPSGERVPLAAEIASVAGREAEPASGPGAYRVAGSAAGGAVLGGAVGGTRGAVIGAVVGAIGATLIAGARDHEVVVPSETELEITLRAPLELP